MRLFFGVKVLDKDKKAIKRIQNALKEQYTGKYTALDNMHITLAFLGEVEPKLLDMLVQIGDWAFEDLQKFAVSADRVDSFKAGEVTYLAVGDDERLTNIYNRLILLLDAKGMVYTQCDSYKPHVTLRRGRKIPLTFSVERVTIDVEEICLYESKRVDDVLRYIPLKVWRLKEK